MSKHAYEGRPERWPVDFLGDLSGPGGNVYAIFGAIKALGREYEMKDLLKSFREQLDVDRAAGRTRGEYEDVLDLIEKWFGPQAAINTLRAERRFVQDGDPIDIRLDDDEIHGYGEEE